jgi:hypothetical protein
MMMMMLLLLLLVILESWVKWECCLISGGLFVVRVGRSECGRLDCGIAIVRGGMRVRIRGIKPARCSQISI